MIEAELPDGTILEFPDGTDPLVIQRAAKQYIGQKQTATPQRPSPGRFPVTEYPRTTEEMRAGARRMGRFGADVGRAAASGATLGHIEEINAKARSLMGGGEYLPLLEKEEARTAEIHPGIRIPGEIAGGMALLPLTGPAAFWGRVPSFLRAVGSGGLYGAGYGHGTARPGERGRGAGAGALLGAGTGGAVNLGLVQAPALAKAFWNTGRAYINPTKAVPHTVGGLFGSEGKSPQQVLASLQRYRQAGKPGTLTDVGYPQGNVQRATRGLAGAGDRAGETVTERLGTMGERARGDIGRIGADVRGAISGKDFFAGREALQKRLMDNARQNYQPVFERYQKLQSPKLAEILDDMPARAQILERARAIAKTQRISGRENFFNNVDKQLDDVAEYGADAIDGLSLQTWDFIKRGLYEVAEGSDGALRSGLHDVRRTLTNELDNLTGGAQSPYAQTRKIYGDDIEIVEAMKKGTNFVRKGPDYLFKGKEEIARELADLSPAAREAYRMAAAQDILSELGETTTEGSAIMKIWNKHNIREKLEALFENKANWAAFADKMNAEMEMAKTSSFIGQGSRTALLSEDINKFKNAWGALAAILGSNSPFGHALVTSAIARRTATSMFGAPARFQEELADALTTTDPAAQRRIIEQAIPYMRSLPRRHPLATALTLEEIQRNQRQR